MNRIKSSLLFRVIIAIIAGIVCGLFFPDWATRIFLTVNSIFSNFLSFIIPLLIFGLVAPSIADLGRAAGRLLLLTVAIAYGFTVFTGFFAYFTCDALFATLLQGTAPLDNVVSSSAPSLTPYFTISIPPLMDIMTALIGAFTIGLGMSVIKGDRIKGVLDEFREIIIKVIDRVIIPILPLFIFGIFLSMSHSGEVMRVMDVFIKIILVIFAMTIILLLLQFSLAGVVSGRNPLRLLRNMLPAYVTALGT